MASPTRLLRCAAWACIAAGALFAPAVAGVAPQQVADPAFDPRIDRPAYPPGRGPLVLVDRGHHTFHARDEHFTQFATILRRDGYRVDGLQEPLTAVALHRAKVLVIVNAIAAEDVDDWTLPTSSAFTGAEVEAVRAWVKGGGSLLLIADHMPFPGAAASLAGALGFELMNGFALVEAEWDPLVFRRRDGTLRAHPISDGRRPSERVDEVATFVAGSAFRAADRRARPLLVFGAGVVSINPQRAWQFDDDTPRVPVEGWLQGATVELGAGRLAVFGEASMFAAQLVGPKRHPVGLNHPLGRSNLQLLLNTMRWLSRAEISDLRAARSARSGIPRNRRVQ